MTYQMTKPLRDMSAAAKQYAKGDFSNRISVPYHKVLGGDEDEVAELVTAFNSMANALSAIETSRRNFVANVSHELKTPMTTIGGFIDGILDGTIDSSKSTYYLRIVSDEVKRLSRLVTGMLNMSKIEAGQLKIQPKEFDISAMTFKTMLGFERAIDEKKIEIRGLDKVEPLNICADEDMINQVVYNLIDNAVKFTNEGGYISWYDFTKEIFRQAVAMGREEYSEDRVSVTPVTTAEYGVSKAKRPFNSRLDKSKLVENGFEPLPTWQDAVARYLKEIEF